jgi:hypothetical protein
MLAFGLGPVAWGKIFVLALIIHLATTLYLAEVLGRAFDPYWKPRLFYSGNGPREQYMAALLYAGAVVFGVVRRTVFGDNGFDFRGRVTRMTALMCLLHFLLLVAMLAAAGMTAMLLGREGWAAWERLPRPPPLPLPDEPPPL